MIISSRKNQRVKEISALKDKKEREKTGLYLIEGEKSVKEAFLLGVEIVAVLGVEDLVLPYADKGVEIVTVTKEIADYVADAVSPQGIVAVAKIGENRLIAPLSSSVLLDGVSDPGNLGTIIRTCAAVGVKEVYLVNSADPFSPKAVRSSMSGIFSVTVRTGEKDEVLKVLENVPIILADMGGENVFDFTPPEKFCLAVGSEAHGLSKEVRESAAHTVKIPMTSKMESLNAGVSASIILYQLLRHQIN